MHYIKESLSLDKIFLFKIKYSFLYKLGFILRKYFLIFKNFIFFKVGESGANFRGRKFYFPNRFGLLSIERVYAANYFLKDYIPEGLTILDVGAHVGEFNTFARQYLKAKDIYSFEPYSKSFNLLSKNTNPEKSFNYAVSMQPEATLFISNVSTQLNSLDKTNTEGTSSSETVKCIKLDDFVKENLSNLKIDMLKIDVEGHEYDVLQSAPEVLKKVKYLYVEVSVERSSERDMGEIIAFIQRSNPSLLVETLSDYKTGERSIDVLFIDKTK